jgi:hypothetical protein
MARAHAPEHAPTTKLAKAITDPQDQIRWFLAGPARDKLVALLSAAVADKAHIYAALFELDDPELLTLLKALKKRAHIVLGNGSVKKKGQDENKDARDELSVCDLKDRMSAPRALAHNKFLVACDAGKQPQAVWTGSTNWTKTRGFAHRPRIPLTNVGCANSTFGSGPVGRADPCHDRFSSYGSRSPSTRCA